MMLFWKMWFKGKPKMDFIQCLGPDLSSKILTSLDDPCDLIRVSAVSKSWYRFVIENGLCKQLCFKMFPEISDVIHSIEVDDMIEPVSNMLEGYRGWECLKRSHKAYAVLAFDLSPYVKNCISEAVVASSTNIKPEESIQNTLEPGDRTDNRPSYWLSKGHTVQEVPETLVYKLCSSPSFIITEIRVQPFQAYFQDGSPIYSAEAIRFKIGYPRYNITLESAIALCIAFSNTVVNETQFVWRYTSPHYQMFQENRLQVFKLPKPVLCNGRVLLVELLGRAQKQGLLYYKGISHVQAVGLPLSAAFKEIRNPSGKYTLKYCPGIRVHPSIRALYSSSSSSSCLLECGITATFIFMMMLLLSIKVLITLILK